MINNISKFMRPFLKNNHILHRSLWLIIIIILIVLLGFSFLIFEDEYRGLADKFLNIKIKFLDVFYFFHQFGSSNLPVYDLVIQPANLEELNQSLPGVDGCPSFLEEHQKKVPATFIYNNQKYKVKVRYHGGAAAHWQGKKKSWQIIFSETNLFNGMRKINLVIPEDRAFSLEHLNHYRAKKMGLLVPETRFIVLKVNGRNPSAYFEIEGWSEEFLEKHGILESNLYTERDMPAYHVDPVDILSQTIYWKKHVNRQDAVDDFSEIKLLVDLITQASDEEFYQKIPNLLDMDDFYKWQAHSILAGSIHQDFIHNMKLYFDPALGKFKLIPWDQEQRDQDRFMDLHYNTLVSRILKNPQFIHQRNKILWDYVKNEENLKDDLEFYDQTYQQIKTAFYQDKIKIYSNFHFDRQVEERRGLLIKQYRNIQNTLKIAEASTEIEFNLLRGVNQINVIAHSFSDILWSGLDLQFDRDIFNSLIGNQFHLYYDLNQNQVFDRGDRLVSSSDFDLSNQKIIFSSIDFQMFAQRGFPEEDWPGVPGQEIKVLPKKYSFFLVNSKKQPLIEPALIKNINFNIINAVTRESALITSQFINQETFSYFEQINDSQESFLQRYHIFRKGLLANQVVLPRGIYNISENIIVPQAVSLLIEPAVQLKFAPDVSLVSYGPVEAKGTKSLPIVFTAQDKNKPWGVVGLVGQKTNKSEFEYCYFDYGSQAYINGVIFSGMLSAHYTDIDVKYCQFSQAEGDDGLNIKYSQNSKIEKNDFHHNQFDGLDLDYSNGQIKNNNFFANGNDGLDICGGRPLIVSNRIEKSSDKCISLGEETKAIVFNNLLLDCQTGIAVKDLAQPIIINNTIIDNQTGLALYQKKEVFGGGFPQVANTIIWHNQEQISLDEKSKIEISYSDIQGGYSGNNNLIQEPIFQNPEQGDYTLLDSQENLGLIKGGNSELIKTIFKEELPSIPMGIINNL